MSISKYNAGRGLMNLGSTQMTKPISNMLKLETLGRKRNLSARGGEGRAWKQPPLARCWCKVIVITVQGGKPCSPYSPTPGFLQWKLLALFAFWALQQQNTFGPNLSLSIFKKQGFKSIGEPIIYPALETIKSTPRHGWSSDPPAQVLMVLPTHLRLSFMCSGNHCSSLAECVLCLT